MGTGTESAEFYSTDALIHDLNDINRAENSSLLKHICYKWIMRRACRNANAVLTVSEYSKQRIIECSGVNLGHVVNVGTGVGVEYLLSV